MKLTILDFYLTLKTGVKNLKRDVWLAKWPLAVCRLQLTWIQNIFNLLRRHNTPVLELLWCAMDRSHLECYKKLKMIGSHQK